jgi:hypothetical protein
LHQVGLLWSEGELTASPVTARAGADGAVNPASEKRSYPSQLRVASDHCENAIRLNQLGKALDALKTKNAFAHKMRSVCPAAGFSSCYRMRLLRRASSAMRPLHAQQ